MERGATRRTGARYLWMALGVVAGCHAVFEYEEKAASDGQVRDGRSGDGRAKDALASDTQAKDVAPADGHGDAIPVTDRGVGKDRSTIIDLALDHGPALDGSDDASSACRGLSDGELCLDGAGICLKGACCTTCIINGTCHPDGQSVDGCGSGGLACAMCAAISLCSAPSCVQSTCVTEPVADGTACGAGVCLGGSCCTGCIDGEGACVAAMSASACGPAGEACQVCASTACTTPHCTDGACDVAPVPAGTPCTLGQCANGSCCKTCRYGSQGTYCHATGKTTSYCGAGGGVCDDCDDGNDCTEDNCSGSTCLYNPVPFGTSCDGGSGKCDDFGMCCKGCLTGTATVFCVNPPTDENCGRGGDLCEPCTPDQECSPLTGHCMWSPY